MLSIHEIHTHLHIRNCTLFQMCVIECWICLTIRDLTYSGNNGSRATVAPPVPAVNALLELVFRLE